LASLAVESLTKNFGSVVALDNVSLEIKTGEFVTLLGPSGCGKTTFLRLVAGLERPTNGRIYLEGECINDIPPYRCEMGLVVQNYALFPHMTVFDNVAYGLKVRRLNAEEIRRRVSEALNMVRLAGFERRFPRQLSGGQQQRCALARAIVIRPRVLLLDEALGALDKKLREEMQVELKQLQRQLHLTTLHVTHDQEEALGMSDRIVVLNHGSVEQFGTPLELYDHPKTEFVASFIGSPSMNFFDSAIQSAGNGLLIDAGSFRVPVPLTRKSAYEPYVGEKVIFGIRPTDIFRSGSEKDDGNFAPVEGRVDVVEPLGPETLLMVKCRESSFLAMVDSEVDFEIGQTVLLHFNMAKMHLFESVEPHRRLGL